jgi:heme-degrading monooxygenase HmoA
MHAVIRQYTGASDLIDQMARRHKDVQALLESIPGFTAYYAVRAQDNLTTVTVCESQKGTEESAKRAAAWVKENLPGLTMAAPQVTGGDVFISFTS